MARDDRLKKAQAAGADFLETARAKAEEFLKELAKTGAESQSRTQGAIDDLVVGGRKGTEQVVSTIRKEIQNQLGALGLATKADLEALEARLSRRPSNPAPAAAPAAKKAAPAAGAAKAPAKKATPVKASATKAPAKKAAKKAAG